MVVGGNSLEEENRSMVDWTWFFAIKVEESELVSNWDEDYSNFDQIQLHDPYAKLDIIAHDYKAHLLGSGASTIMLGGA